MAQQAVLEIPLDDDLFKVLASESRREILRCLQERRMTGTELATRLSLGKPAVSEHLKRLHEAGLVERHDDEERRWVYFSLSQKGQQILEPKRTRFILMLALGVAGLLVGLAAGVALYGLLDSEGLRPDQATEFGTGPDSGLDGAAITGDYVILAKENVDLANGTFTGPFSVVADPTPQVTTTATTTAAPAAAADGPDATDGLATDGASPVDVAATPDTDVSPGDVLGNATEPLENATATVQNLTGVVGDAADGVANATDALGNATGTIGGVIGNATEANATDPSTTEVPVPNATACEVTTTSTVTRDVQVALPTEVADPVTGITVTTTLTTTTQALFLETVTDNSACAPDPVANGTTTTTLSTMTVPVVPAAIPAGEGGVPDLTGNATSDANATGDTATQAQGVTVYPESEVEPPAIVKPGPNPVLPEVPLETATSAPTTSTTTQATTAAPVPEAPVDADPMVDNAGAGGSPDAVQTVETAPAATSEGSVRPAQPLLLAAMGLVALAWVVRRLT